MTREKTLRWGIVGALLGAWLALRIFKPEWAAVMAWPVVKTAENYGWWVPAVGAGLLVAAIGLMLWGAFGPKKVHHPEDGMAQGCLMIATIAAGIVLLVLAAGVWLRWYAVVNVISFLLMATAALMLPQAAWTLGRESWQKRREKWKNKHRWVKPAELAEFLSGKTHIVERETREPARKWREWRYYAADGRMRGFEEADGVEGKLTEYAGVFRWTVGERGLEVHKEGEKNVLRYVIMVRRDGAVSYFTDDEGTGNGVLAFRTVQVREGEPDIEAPEKN